MTTEITALKKQLVKFEKKATKMAGKGKKEALAEVKKLEKMRDTSSKKVKKYATASEDAWKIAKKGIDAAWNDLTKAFKKASKKFA